MGQDEGGEGVDIRFMSITADGETLGTMGYMAPEQCGSARDADHRADIYGLGATLFHCLVGRPPFVAPNEYRLAELIDANRAESTTRQRAADQAIGALRSDLAGITRRIRSTNWTRSSSSYRRLPVECTPYC